MPGLQPKCQHYDICFWHFRYNMMQLLVSAPCRAKMMQYVNILLLTFVHNEFNVIKWTKKTLFGISLTLIDIYNNVLTISLRNMLFEFNKLILNTKFWHNSVIKFISQGNIIFVTLKIHYFRWCDSWCRAGFFSRLIYCCPIQPRPKILSLGVTTISMTSSQSGAWPWQPVQ